MDADGLLRDAASLAARHVAGLDERPVGARAGAGELRAALGGQLGEEGVSPERVLTELAAGADGGLVASPGPRYFGFVTGGALPVSLAADWLGGARGQIAGPYAPPPAAGGVGGGAARRDPRPPRVAQQAGGRLP